MTLMPPPSLGATYQYIHHRPPRSRAELYCCGGGGGGELVDRAKGLAGNGL